MFQVRFGGEPVPAALQPHVPQRSLQRVADVLYHTPGEPWPADTNQHLGGGRPDHLFGAEGIEERRRGQALRQAQFLDLTAAPVVLLHGPGVGADDVGVQSRLVALPGESQDLPPDARVGERHVARVDQWRLVLALRQSLHRVGQGPEGSSGPLEARQGPPPVGEDVDQLGVERVGAGHPLAVGRLPVGARCGVPQRLVVIAIGVRHVPPNLLGPERGEEPPVQDREDVVPLHRRDDVLRPPHDLRQPLLHLLAAHAGVVLEPGAGERRHHRGAGDVAGRCAQVLDDRQRRGREVAVAGPDVQAVVQVLEHLVDQD